MSSRAEAPGATHRRVAFPWLTKLIRFGFGFYAGGLFIGTHWPGVRIEGPVPRSDLWIHLAVFGFWNSLMLASSVFGPALSKRNITRSTAVAVAYAAVDESLQGIPMLNRVAALDDFAANALGILLAAIFAFMLRAIIFRRNDPDV